MTLAKRLRKARRERNLTQKELAALVGISQQTVQELESGESKSSNHIMKFSKALQVKAGWLQFGEGNDPFEAMSDLYKKIPHGRVPVIEWKQAIQWSIESEDAINFSGKTIASPCPERKNKNIFSLRIKGDSMIGKNMAFTEGSYIVIDPDQNHKEGDYVVAIKSAAKEAVFRQLITEGGNDILVPLNPQYKTIEEDFHIIGVMIVHINYFI